MNANEESWRCQNCNGPDTHLSKDECIRSLADRLFSLQVYTDRLAARLVTLEEDHGIPQP